MTHDPKHIKALASMFENYRLGRDGRTSEEAASNLLDLIGPKPLVWEWPNDYGVVVRAVTAHGTYSLHDDEDSAGCRMFADFHITGDADCTKYAIRIAEGYCELEELQSAAESHHVAAFWAMSGLVGE